MFKDKNSDHISFQSLKAVAKELGETISDEELKEIIKEVGKSGGGGIKIEDFIRVVSKSDKFI